MKFSHKDKMIDHSNLYLALKEIERIKLERQKLILKKKNFFKNIWKKIGGSK